MSSSDPTIMYVPLSEGYNRDDCKFLAETYDKKQRLGKGAYGSVYELCKKASNDCSFALKVMIYDKEKYEMIGGEPLSKNYIKTIWEREVRIFHKLNQCQRAWGYQFVPIIHDSWLCEEENFTWFFIVVERFDGNLEDFIRLFKGQEAIKIAAMAKLDTLSRDLKIIHKSCRICLNDIKLPNILYKQTGKYSYVFVFTDLGIATDNMDEECHDRDSARFKESIQLFEKLL